ncbi:MAG: hypothetical protein RIR00_92 [Pseudomonadota bacterium]|jgi:thioredoxin reductase (NADPH)
MATETRPALTLLSRDYCHLCHDMAAAVQALLAEYGAELTVVDVDADPELVARYDELVPVLLIDDEEICHYFLEESKVRAVLQRFR